MLPHYYSVYLPDFDLRLELVPTVRAAEMRITFGATDSPGLVIDPFKGGSVEYDEKSNSIIGQSVQNLNHRCKPVNMKHDFKIVLDRKAVSSEKLLDGSFYVKFAPVKQGEEIIVKLATSFISQDQASLNLRELGDGNFDRLVKEGKSRWNELLGRVKIESDNLPKLQTFYTCLYRSLMFPRIHWEVDAKGDIVHWSPTLGDVRRGYYYAGTGFWDTFRALFPLLNFLYPEENAKMMAGLENCWKECSWLPEWSAPGPSNCMIGNNSASVVADAWISGVREGYDINELYKALIHGANNAHPEIGAVGRMGVEHYNTKGYVPRDVEINNSVSRTLEYAYNDWCIAELGKALGRPEDEVHLYQNRSKNWKNVFDPARKIVVGRNSDGSFFNDFNPFMWEIDFCEGNAYHWVWCVFHDIPGLREVMGGEDEFERRLDEIFTLPPKAFFPPRRQVSHEAREMQVAGMGQYAHGNQPIQHLIYLYAWTKSPWKAGLRAREAMEHLYAPVPDGYCGDEDNGQTSAWYVWSAMGLYPVCPGSDSYVAGAPLFDEIDLTFASGKKLKIKADDIEKSPRRISSVKVNGKQQEFSRILRKDIHAGGKLEFD
jgi:predicted alpha-1,2-mannosidase